MAVVLSAVLQLQLLSISNPWSARRLSTPMQRLLASCPRYLQASRAARMHCTRLPWVDRTIPLLNRWLPPTTKSVASVLEANAIASRTPAATGSTARVCRTGERSRAAPSAARYVIELLLCMTSSLMSDLIALCPLGLSSDLEPAAGSCELPGGQWISSVS